MIKDNKLSIQKSEVTYKTIIYEEKHHCSGNMISL